MGKRPSFAETATDLLNFLIEHHGFTGPEIERPWDRIPAVTRVRYHRPDVIVEVSHERDGSVSFMIRPAPARLGGRRLGGCR